MAKKLGGEVGWWCPSLSDTANDLSGNANHGTYNGGMGTVSDVGNGGTRAYSFDGSDDYIDISSILLSADIMAISLWANLANVSDTKMLLCGGDESTGKRRGILARTSKIEFNGYNADYPQVGVGPSNIAANIWTHLCVVIQRTTTPNVKIYINGTLDIYGDVGPNSPDATITGQMKIGSNVAGGENKNCKQDDIRVFNRVITQAEITKLASKRGYQPAANNLMMGVGI